MTATEVAPGTIGRRAGRGLRWSLAGTMVNKLGSFAMGLVLARLLAPSDFGIYAIALAATNVLMHVNDVGLIAATVQWRGKLAEVAPTATTMAAGFAIAIYGLFWVAAPSFAAAAGDPAATAVVRILSLLIVIDGLAAVRNAALMRTFRQDKLILALSAGLVVNAALAISLAASGAGAFSFAWGQVAGVAVTNALVFAFARVPLRLGFDRRIARQLMRFGIPLAASLGIEAVVMNVQFTIVGRIAGSVALGFFLLAFNVSSWAQTVLGTAIRYVSVAGFSRLSEHDDESLSAGVQRSMPLLVTVVAPIVALMSVLAVPLIALLYGGRWAPAGPVLAILVGLTLVRMVTGLAMDVLMGAGATRSTLWLNLAWAAVLIPVLWVATRLDGIRGAAVAQVGGGLLVAIPLAALALHLARVRLAPMGPALLRPLLAAVLAGGVALVAARLAGQNPVVQLLVGGCAGLVAYLPLGVPRPQLRRCVATLRRGRPQPAGALD